MEEAAQIVSEIPIDNWQPFHEVVPYPQKTSAPSPPPLGESIQKEWKQFIEAKAQASRSANPRRNRSRTRNRRPATQATSGTKITDLFYQVNRIQENDSVAGGTTERDEDSSRTVTEESSNVHEEHSLPAGDEIAG